MEKPPIIFLCGEAGVGKTTIIQRALAKIELRPGGFTTDEIRDKGRRIGFEIKTLSGEKGMLAHVDFRSRFWVGKYYVNIKDLESVGVTSLEKAVADDELIIIDEIGKMELFSKKFKAVVRDVLQCGKPILGAIMSMPHPFADEIKQMPEIQILDVTKQNRNRLIGEVIKLFS